MRVLCDTFGKDMAKAKDANHFKDVVAIQIKLMKAIESQVFTEEQRAKLPKRHGPLQGKPVTPSSNLSQKQDSRIMPKTSTGNCQAGADAGAA